MMILQRKRKTTGPTTVTSTPQETNTTMLEVTTITNAYEKPLILSRSIKTRE
jgi:hypothetical protein